MFFKNLMKHNKVRQMYTQLKLDKTAMATHMTCLNDNLASKSPAMLPIALAILITTIEGKRGLNSLTMSGTAAACRRTEMAEGLQFKK